jgi:hypothetical protein
MANNFLILGTLTAFGWLFVNGPSPSTEPAERPSVSQVAAIDFSVTPTLLPTGSRRWKRAVLRFRSCETFGHFRSSSSCRDVGSCCGTTGGG